MLYFDPSDAGLETFRSYIHQNQVTGLLHFLFMPLACAGAFTMLQGLFFAYFSKNDGVQKSKRFTNAVLFILILFFEYGYLQKSHAILGTLTLLAYLYIIYSVINFNADVLYSALYSALENQRDERFLQEIGYFITFCGAFFLGFSLFMMEIVGHWCIEGHGSTLSQFFNSVYHTPLYGTIALFEFLRIF
jgi:uncharacterized membrane protein